MMNRQQRRKLLRLMGAKKDKVAEVKATLNGVRINIM